MRIIKEKTKIELMEEDIIAIKHTIEVLKLIFAHMKKDSFIRHDDGYYGRGGVEIAKELLESLLQTAEDNIIEI